MRSIDVTAGHLASAESGVEGPLVVLLHAGYVDHSMWERELTHLAHRARVVAPDARTHGGSSSAMEPFRHCDDIAAMVRHLDAGPATLIGASMGAATDTALEYPELVRALVISGAGTNEPVFDDPWAIDHQAKLQHAVETHDATEWITAILECSAGPSRSVDDLDPAAVGRLRTMHQRFAETHVRPGVVPPCPVEDSWLLLGEVAVPVLGIVGEIDSTDHHWMCERAVTGVRDGRGVVRIPEAGHYPNLEQPQQWERTFDAFLDDLETPRAADAMSAAKG